jgi:hypothetical protein
MMRSIILVAVASSAAAAEPPPPVDVHIDFSIAPVDQDAIDRDAAVRAARSAPQPHWLELTYSDVPCLCMAEGHDAGGSAFHARLELARHYLGVGKSSTPIYGIVGVDFGHASTTTRDAGSEQVYVDAVDTQGLVYGGVAITEGRLEDHVIVGAGFEHTVGMAWDYNMIGTSVTSYDAVAELMDVFVVRVSGPVGVIAGFGALAHFGSYRTPNGMSSFTRMPALEGFVGVAIAAY